jgi:hypothetical protein
MRRIFLLVLSASFACQRSPAPAPAAQEKPAPQQPGAPENVQEKEPNDYQRAQEIPLRAVVSGALDAPRDEDWFRLAPGAGKTLALRVELKQATNAELQIYDRDRNPLLRVHAGGEDLGVIPAVACVEACFVEVSGAGPQKYSLTVLGAPPEPGRELEPNDRAVDANDLAAGKPMQGTFHSPEDEDWYRLVLTPGPSDFLRIETTPVDGVRQDLDVRALSDGALLAELRGGDRIFVRDLSLRLGAEAPDGGAPDASSPAPVGYYLVLKGKSKHGAPLTPYTLTATLEAGPPDLEVEPNDDLQHATPVRDTASGFLAPAGDQDYYRVHADAGSVLRAEVSGVPRTDLELRVVAADGGVLARANEGGTKEGETIPAVGVPAGDSFVLVRAVPKDGADPDNLYKLSLTLSPDDGSLEREPNNDVWSAQILALPIEVKGFIWPRKDVDFFRFHVPPDHAPVSVLLSAVRGVDLQLRLYELHGGNIEVIGSSDAIRGEGEEKLVSVPLKEGDFAVEVSSPRNKDASATQPYTLSVK